MGWIGTGDALMAALDAAGADQDDSGKFFVRGDITSFLGAGDEFVVGEDAQYLVGGEWRSLADILGNGEGGLKVQVL